MGERTIKIVARNHQIVGVNRAIRAVANRAQNQGRLGVFWHTQGSGKSYSMLFFTRKVHRRVAEQMFENDVIKDALRKKW